MIATGSECLGRNLDIFSVRGYDGMHLIYEALKKTRGRTDADVLIAAAKRLGRDPNDCRSRHARRNLLEQLQQFLAPNSNEAPPQTDEACGEGGSEAEPR